MTSRHIETIKMEIVDTAKSHGKIITLHVFDKDHHNRQFDGSSIDGGYFTELLVSRPRVVRFAAPATQLPGRNYFGSYDERNGLHVPGLHVHCTDRFNPEFDWALAIEEDLGCDPGWKVQKILGPSEMTESMISEAVRQTLNISDGNSFVRYELGGSVLGNYRF